MYLKFYGLKELPFNITPDPRFLFFTQRHREALDSLVYGIEHRAGFMELVGEVGSGKTTICRAVLARLPRHIETALILNPSLNETQLVRAILGDLGVGKRRRDRLDLIEQLNEYLLDKARLGINVAVLIDEAQDLTAEVMEQVRLLSNLETDQHKLLQIVLSGQPELERRLADPSLRQLRQRIVVKCSLDPLDAAETYVYIEHRLHVAGSKDLGLFDEEAVELVHRVARGIPRLVNKVCDRAMLAGYAAGAKSIGRAEVKRAVAELEDLT